MTDTSPSAFPRLGTVAAWNRLYRGRRGCQVCPVCRLAVEPRNGQRHAKACAARKRADPARWAEWHRDMIEASKGGR